LCTPSTGRYHTPESSVRCIRPTTLPAPRSGCATFLSAASADRSAKRYIEQRGHPRLRARHAPFAIDQGARDRWIELMMRALDETALPAEADAVLRAFFHSTATFMINRG
jgi:truncated hemoglobin YjbI